MKLELNFDTKETKMLIEILESYLSDLRMEIAGTDRMEYREHLKERKGLLNNLLNTLTISPQTH